MKIIVVEVFSFVRNSNESLRFEFKSNKLTAEF